MIFDQEGNTVIITQEKVSILELIKKLEIIYIRFQNNNIIINLTSLVSLSVNDFVEFLQISNKHRGTKHSFVIVSDKFDTHEIPDELIVVPTLQEAKDIIEMEDIERDLGF